MEFFTSDLLFFLLDYRKINCKGKKGIGNGELVGWRGEGKCGWDRVWSGWGVCGEGMEMGEREFSEMTQDG